MSALGALLTLAAALGELEARQPAAARICVIAGGGLGAEIARALLARLASRHAVTVSPCASIAEDAAWHITVTAEANDTRLVIDGPAVALDRTLATKDLSSSEQVQLLTLAAAEVMRPAVDVYFEGHVRAEPHAQPPDASTVAEHLRLAVQGGARVGLEGWAAGVRGGAAASIEIGGWAFSAGVALASVPTPSSLSALDVEVSLALVRRFSHAAVGLELVDRLSALSVSADDGGDRARSWAVSAGAGLLLELCWALSHSVSAGVRMEMVFWPQPDELRVGDVSISRSHVDAVFGPVLSWDAW